MPATYISTKGWSKEKILAKRREFIGSSDVPIIMGLSKYKSPLDLYHEKLSEVPPSAEPPSEEAEFGIEMEEMIARIYTRRTGHKVVRDNKIRIHPLFPWLTCQIDRVIESADGRERGILEIKTASQWVVKEWDLDIAPEYYVQVQQQLAVGGFTWGEVALAVDRRLWIIPFVPDESVINEIIERAVWFRNCIMNRTPPEYEVRDTEKIEPKPESSIEATPEIIDAIKSLQVLEAQEKEVADNADQFRDEIKLFMAEHELLTVQGIAVAQYQSVKSMRLDSKKLKAAEPKLYEKYSAEAVSRRFSLRKNVVMP